VAIPDRCRRNGLAHMEQNGGKFDWRDSLAAESAAKLQVFRGATHDGIGKYLSRTVEVAPGEPVNVVEILRDTYTDIVVSYLPVGSEKAAEWYAEQVLEAGCAFVNCIPVFKICYIRMEGDHIRWPTTQLRAKA